MPYGSFVQCSFLLVQTLWVEKILKNLTKCDRKKKSKDEVETESTPKHSKLKTDTII